MSFIKPKTPTTDETISNNRSADLNKCSDCEPSTSYEVFRNNTTAVEVIVKEVLNKNKKKSSLEPNGSSQTIRRLREEVECLQRQLAKSNSTLAKTRKGFRMIICEMKKQLDFSNHLELERQKENLNLLLENEKLKTLLETKTNVVSKYKREFSTMKRVLKIIMKNISFTPQINESVLLSSDPEFEDFERDLKKDIHVKFAANIFESMGATFDSTISKDTKDSFDRPF